jgi:hypothetical protein
MAAIGDRVQVPSKRVGQAPRDGIVTGVSGALLQIAWSGGEVSTIMPSMGSLVVVGKVKVRAKKGNPAVKTSSKKVVKAPAKATKRAVKASRTGAAKSSAKRSGGARKRGK